jgi:hypothetical protein
MRSSSSTFELDFELDLTLEHVVRDEREPPMRSLAPAAVSLGVAGELGGLLLRRLGSKEGWMVSQTLFSNGTATASGKER